MIKQRKIKENRKKVRIFPRWKAAWRFIQPYGARHWFCLVLGLGAALAAVAMRLGLPWAMIAVMKPALAAAQLAPNALAPNALAPNALAPNALAPNALAPNALAPAIDSWMVPALQLGALIVGMFFLLGWADCLERLHFARFVIRTVRKLRTDIMSRVLDDDSSSIQRGDMVSRLVGDTARLKAGLNGFLVHISANAILFLGVTAVLFWVNVELGLVLAAGGASIFLITVKGAGAVYRRSIKNRNKEGELGNLIIASGSDDADEEVLEKLNRSSGKQEAVVTKIQGYTTWAVYTVFGLVVALGLFLALREIAARRLDGSVAVVFALYAMQLRTPLVQMARQGAGTGKIVACSERLEELLLEPAAQKERAS